MLRFEDALARILALGAPPLETENVALEELDGRVLAEDITAGLDLPGFDHSAMDGYAVNTADIRGLRLPIVGESRTGMVPEPLTSGTAMRIFTGAMLPAGANAVVMQENVRRDDDVAVLVSVPPPGQSIRSRGEDLSRGAIALVKGTRLRPAHLALAASLDRATLPVVRQPLVAVLATGDELRPPGSPPLPGTIPESNTVVLRSMARRAGARTPGHAYVPDVPEATARAFATALDAADVLVTVGGVSVGDHDLVRPALEAVGVILDFWRVALKPGKPLAVGRLARPGRRDAIALCLPGNPASAMVTFALFGIPLLRAMQGDPRPFPLARRARMTRAHEHVPGRTEFARARINPGTELSVTTFENQASGAVTTMAGADAFVVIPAEAVTIPEGAEVDVLLTSDLGV